MAVALRSTLKFCILLSALLCCSCLGIGVKNPQVDGDSGQFQVKDPKLVDKWELQYQVGDDGAQAKPDKNRVLLEFTKSGQVILNIMDRENPSEVNTPTKGNYTTENGEITVTDKGLEKWPYSVKGDTLRIYMPGKKQSFYWKRAGSTAAAQATESN
jgi:hypothetical protein